MSDVVPGPVKATGRELRQWNEEDGPAIQVSKHFYWSSPSGGGKVWWCVDETERLFGPCSTLEEAAEAYVRNIDYLQGEA
jgi:hypothetical protein